MRRLLVALLVLAALAGVADRVAVAVVERELARRVAAAGGLPGQPAVDVEVRGFPFLTQALSGRYDDVRARTSGRVGSVTVSRLDARLRGLRVPLSDALSGDVQRVPVDGLSGSLLLSYAEVSRLAPERVRVSRAGDRLRVTGTLELLGRELSAAAVGRVAVRDGVLQVRPQQLEAGGALLDGATAEAFARLLSFDVRLGTLPYGLVVTGVDARPEGVLLRARSGPTVLTA